jgi:superfamily I DNA/RNA helicase
MTYNSFGFKAVMQAFPGTELFDDKLESILIELHPEDNDEGYIIRSATERLVDLCKAYMEDGTDHEVLAEIMDRFNIDLGDDGCDGETLENRNLKVMNLVAPALKLCLNRTAVIDYNDQVWFTVMKNLPVERFDIVLVDEAQDTNMMQQKLVEMACPDF